MPCAINEVLNETSFTGKYIPFKTVNKPPFLLNKIEASFCYQCQYFDFMLIYGHLLT